MRIEGKHTLSYELEYEFKQTENRYSDRIELECTYNKKNLRRFRKGVKATVRYLQKMKRLGFEPIEQITYRTNN